MTRRVVALVTGLVASFGLSACAEDFGSDLSNAGWEYSENGESFHFRSDDGTPTRDPRRGDDDGGADTTGGTDGGSDDGSNNGDPNGGDGGGIYIGNGIQDPSGDVVDPAFGLNTAEGMPATIELLDEQHTLAEYLVECALAPYQSVTKEIDGETVVFHGLLGLAPEWADGSCNEDCQQWVTSCMLARTNVSGDEILVGLRSDHDEIGTSPTPGFPHYEASWYGNMFTDPPLMYMCEGNTGGTIAAQLEGRTCIAGLCEFTNTGSCLSAQRCEVLKGTRVECTDDNGTDYRTLSTYVDNAN